MTRMILKESVSFKNSYSKETDTIELKWKVEDGFPSIEDAMKVLETEGFLHDRFSYVIFMGMVYPVAMATRTQIIALSAQHIWFWNNENCIYDKYKLGKEHPVPYTIEDARISTVWDDGILAPFKKADPEMSCIPAKKSRNKKPLIANSPIILVHIFFDTLVPVYQLDCMTPYCLAEPPVNMELGEVGISAYNPFNDNREHRYKNGTAYTYEDYCSEQAGAKEKKKNKKTSKKVVVDMVESAGAVVDMTSQAQLPEEIVPQDFSQENEAVFLKKLEQLFFSHAALKKEIEQLKEDNDALRKRVLNLESINGFDGDINTLDYIQTHPDSPNVLTEKAMSNMDESQFYPSDLDLSEAIAQAEQKGRGNKKVIKSTASSNSDDLISEVSEINVIQDESTGILMNDDLSDEMKQLLGMVSDT